MIVYCEIIKWTYGEHYYGFLTCGSNQVRLEGDITQWGDTVPGTTALIKGSDVDPDPQPIWDGPYQDEAEELMAEMGVYYDNPEVLDEIRGDWEDILAHLGG